MVVLAFIRVLKSQLASHFDLLPLAVAVGTTGTMSVSAMIYTSMSKKDVVFNRWSKTLNWQKLDISRPQQKLFSPLDSRSAYQRDPVLEGLRNEMYAEGRYAYSPASKEHH